jgi:hypothetical protein
MSKTIIKIIIIFSVKRKHSEIKQKNQGEAIN